MYNVTYMFFKPGLEISTCLTQVHPR
jgi:hypothetical protein